MSSGPNLYRWRFGTTEFDEARLELRVGGLSVDVEQKPLQVLAVLLRHAGEVVTKRELFESVWADRITVDHVLATAVGKLRKALGEDGERLIVTVPRIGYRLSGAVERIAVGRRHVSALYLKPGDAVPWRDHFVLERQLGPARGSEVWLARHTKTHEPRVYKFSPDGERLSALKREATLSRVLRESLGPRQDFVRVIDWNFEQAPFFLESEYGGLNLDEWAAGEGRLAAMPRGERIELFLRICDAVAAAHGVGVLHKDIKPTNVLIEAHEHGWHLRLTDFGSSRLLEPGRLAALGITELGLTMTQGAATDSSSGTPLYLAPELIAGQAPTVKSDVYALGITLYQLLVGDLKRPMASGWAHDIDDELLSQDLARATDGEPGRRFASVSELTQGLRSLEARRAEGVRLAEIERRARISREILAKARARRPWIVATIVVLLLALSVSLGLYGYAERARKRAVMETARAEAINQFLRTVMIQADPRAGGSGRQTTIGEALDHALSDGLDGRFSDAPETAAQLHIVAADIYGGRGEFEASEAHWRRAAEIYGELHAPGDAQRLRAIYRLAQVLSNRSDYVQAGTLIDEADRLAGRRLTSDPILALEAAWSRARWLLLQARVEEALPLYEAARRAQQTAASDDLLAVFAIDLDLAQCYSRLQRHEEAIVLLEALRAPRYLQAGVSQSRRAIATLFLGAAHLYAGHHEDAEPLLLQAISALERAYGADSFNVLEARGTLANLYAATGRWHEALPLLEQTRGQACARFGTEHLSCLVGLGNESVIRMRLGDTARAIEGMEQTRAGFARVMGEGSPGVQAMDFYRADLMLAQGNTEMAAAIAASLDARILDAGSPGEYWEPRLSGLLGRIELSQKQDGRGRERVRSALAELEDAQAPEWFTAPLREALLNFDARPL
ncbi:MAG: tetratricopeptide repeat protein [Pseudomonadota bacterium]|nr:tetratricopeptide repeat protein [Pseudomonadota bacterium]